MSHATMPSPRHEAIVQLIRDKPSLLLACGDAVARALPAEPRFDVVDTSVTDLAPRTFHGDLAFVATGSDGRDPVVILVEGQLRPDEGARRRWALKLAALGVRHGGRAILVVVTPSAAVARWATKRRPSSPGALSLAPIVIGPDAIPRIASVEQALAAPELAVLAAIAHGKEDLDAEHARQAIDAANALETAGSPRYITAILDALPDVARRILEASMFPLPFGRLAPVLRRNLEDIITQGIEEGIAQRLEEAARERRQKERQEGRQEGEIATKRTTLEGILATRGFVVTESQSARIAAGLDSDLLGRWILRAVTAGSADEALE